MQTSALALERTRSGLSRWSLLLIFCVLMWQSWSVQAAITRGPYLQKATTDSIMVVWEGSGFSAPSINYGIQSAIPRFNDAVFCQWSHGLFTVSRSRKMTKIIRRTNQANFEVLF